MRSVYGAYEIARASAANETRHTTSSKRRFITARLLVLRLEVRGEIDRVVGDVVGDGRVRRELSAERRESDQGGLGTVAVAAGVEDVVELHAAGDRHRHGEVVDRLPTVVEDLDACGARR